MKKFVFIITFCLSSFIFAMSPNSNYLNENGKKLFWCNDTKETLKTKFSKLLELYLLEEKYTDQNAKGRNNQELWEPIQKLRRYFGDENEHANVLLYNVLTNEVTTQKIEAYLEAASANPAWGNPRDAAIKLLVFLTDHAIEEQRVFKNTPFATSVLKILLERGISPTARISEKHLSALEIAQSKKSKAYKQMEGLKKYLKKRGEWYGRDTLDTQSYHQYNRAHKCTEEIIRLFKRYQS